MKAKLNTHKLVNFVTIIGFIIISSCASNEKLVYFQDEMATAEDDVIYNSELIYKPNDLLTIDVSALDAEAAKPFNLSAVSYNSTSVISAQGTLKMQTYFVDSDGNIDFPVLGTVKVGGLTRSQATVMMKEKLNEYLKDHVVNIRLANFNVTIIGEVNNPGTYTIADERVSLTEALGLAGDLTIYGKRDNVLLIRENNGKKQYAKFDLTSIRVLNSPNYYLAQNDVIYVEPNNSRVRQSTFNPNNGVIISAVATLATIAAILIK